jgi:hypothetical protein
MKAFIKSITFLITPLLFSAQGYAQYGDFYQSQTKTTVGDSVVNAGTQTYLLTPRMVEGKYSYAFLITALRGSGSNSGNVYLEQSFDKTGAVWTPVDTIAFSGSSTNYVKFTGSSIDGTYLRARAVTTSTGKWFFKFYAILRRNLQ